MAPGILLAPPNARHADEQGSINLRKTGSLNQPVGDPAIALWKYDNFAVYFKYQNVIHSIIKISKLNSEHGHSGLNLGPPAQQVAANLPHRPIAMS